MGGPDTSPPNNSSVSSAPKILRIILFLAGIEGLAAVFLIGQTRSAEGGVLFGLSAFRLALAGVILLFSSFFLIAAWRWNRNFQVLDRIEAFLRHHRSGLSLAAFWFGILFLLFVQEQYFQIFFAQIKAIDIDLFYQRLQPFLGWLALVLIELSLGIIIAFQVDFKQQESKQAPFVIWLAMGIIDWVKSRNRVSLQTAIQRMWKKRRFEFLVWGTFLLVWLLISLTGMGIEPDDRFWNVAGVPVLPQQLILSGLLLLLLLDLKHRYGGKLGKFFDRPASAYLLIGIIWLGTFLFWQSTELKHTYFAPDPYPPNYVRYPFSDARAFDIGGQAFLQGFGLNNNITTDRPFLMTFTALLHAIGGQEYDQYIKIQLAILALIPALLFILGWKFHSKTAGLGVALLMILQQGNAIRASAEIGLVNAKVLMSELPTALLLIAITIYLIRWLEKKDSKLSPLITGSLLGLAVGVRGNTLVLIPVVLAIVLVKYLLEDPKGFRNWAQASGVFLLGVTIVLGPYSIRSYQQDGTVFWLSKIQDVLQRSELESNEEDVGGARVPKPVNPERVFSDQNSEPGLLSYSLNHFLHNEITSVLIFPLDWRVTPLAGALEHPVWDYDQDWQGQLANGEKITLGVNLLVISFGIVFAFRRHGLAGIVPLLFHLAYNLSNALARTSGGRYLVPVEWVVILYYFLGVVSIYYSLRNWIPSPKPDHLHTSGIRVLDVTVLTGVVLLSISFLFTGQIPIRFPDDSETAQIALVEDYGQDWIEQSGLNIKDLRSFINSERGVLRIGLVLYPRFYPGGEIPIRSSHVPVMPHDQNRVTFVVMEKDSVDYIHLGLGNSRVSQFPHADYGLLLGCLREDYIDAIVFIPMTKDAPDFVEQADLALSCDVP